MAAFGKKDFTSAAVAIRAAQRSDGPHPEWAATLPVVEELAAADEKQRWTPERAIALFRHLQKVGATGETTALSELLLLGSGAKAKLVRDRLDQWLGQGKGTVKVTQYGRISVSNFPKSIASLEPLRGLPINILNASPCAFTDLEPLRGMPLTDLNIADSAVATLEPIKGMPLTKLDIHSTKITSIEPLRGMPLVMFIGYGCKISDYSPLRGMPLEEVHLAGSRIKDLSFLAHSPIKLLKLSSCQIADLSPLRGLPIEELDIDNNPIADLSVLRSLTKLQMVRLSRKSHWELLRSHPTLRRLFFDYEGESRSVAEVWKEYDALKAAGQK